jgi:hypothetical protein
MVAVSFLDAVLADDSADRSERVAEHLVQASLVELSQIEKLDDRLAPADPTHFDRSTAQLLRDAYERWVTDAESLVERIDRVQRRLGAVAQTEALRDACGKTRARLSISLDQMEQSIQALAEGRLVSSEEVRRELQLRVH